LSWKDGGDFAILDRLLGDQRGKVRYLQLIENWNIGETRRAEMCKAVMLSGFVIVLSLVLAQPARTEVAIFDTGTGEAPGFDNLDDP
jgi:hypothetical protein